jgi:NAD(P)-dependent dehydrogenase (short-subunit alcohol dehydrogenase family)
VPISFNFTGQTALVTGGYSGLGRTVAFAFAEAGANVAIVGRDPVRTNEMQQELSKIGCQALGIVADVRKPEDVKRAVASAMARFGKIEILVNSAGVFRNAPALKTSDEEWNDILATNLNGTFTFCREVGAHMVDAKYGRIVNITSTDAFTAIPEEVAYCASKAAVVAMTQVMAIEWIKSGVNVNAVAPCDFDTPMLAPAMADPATASWIVNALPVGRIGRPEEIIPAVLYLASPEAEMIVGHTLTIDGGRRVV